MNRRNSGVLGLALAVVSLLGFAAFLPAQVRLPSVIGDHMVVQQDKPFAVWGWAGKAEAVTVLFNGQEKQAVAAADGTWRRCFRSAQGGRGPARTDRPRLEEPGDRRQGHPRR